MTRVNKFIQLAGMIMLIAMPVGPVNAEQVGPIPFDTLSDEQRETFGMEEQAWNALPAQRQRNLIKGFDRWQQMTPEQRERATTRLERWQSLSPEKRARLQKRFRWFQSLTPQQKRRVLKARQRFRTMSPAERQALRRKWRQSH